MPFEQFRPRRGWIGFGAACVCALMLAACGGSAPPASGTNNDTQGVPPSTPLPSPTQDFSALPTDAAGQPIVARVNGESVTLTDYQETLVRYQQQGFAFADTGALQAAVLSTLVEQVLIEQAAAQQNVVITDAELDAELANYIEQAGGEAGWQTWLNTNGYTADEFRATLRDSLTVNRMRDQVTLVVLGELPQVRARHILVHDEALAQQILAEIQAGGDFAALAAQYSVDLTTKDNGGDLGWFTREELLDETLANVAFTTEPGTITGPVATMLGYHILQTLERGNRLVDEAKRPQLAQVFFDRWLDSLTESSTIEYFLQN